MWVPGQDSVVYFGATSKMHQGAEPQNAVIHEALWSEGWMKFQLLLVKMAPLPTQTLK